jgi:CheY-like chemotaxis protein
MTFTPPISAPVPGTLKKKRVLLLDTSATKRELRAEIMRKLGMDVDCASDIAEGRSWWRADLYDLVLIDMEKGSGHRDQFCEDIRGATPPQQLAFFVGKPEYLADAPTSEEELVHENGDGEAADIGMAATLDRPVHGRPQWGILEASRRISAVRSASVARTQAIRNLPAPPRDSEARLSKRAARSTRLDELLREEKQ